MSISLPFFLDVLLLLFTLSQVTLSFGSVSSATIDDAAGDSNTGVLPVYSPLNAFSPVRLVLSGRAPITDIHLY
jgi:hypothetical protein